MQKETTAFNIKSINVSAYFCGDEARLASSYDCHHHNACEIYINISGKVAFRVEDRVYNIKSGDVILTRPSEKHHCILKEAGEHNHFCIHFSANEHEEVFRVFYDRKSGESNLVSLSSHKR